MSNLIIKSPNLPIKAYPQEALESQQELFMKWITDLLGLRGEESAKRLVLAIPVILKKFHSLSFTEVKRAFEMYALGELQTQPITNYFDIILVGKVFNEYKNHIRTEKPKQSPEEKEKEYKDNQDFMYVVTLFDFYVQNNKIPKESYWTYSYLESKLADFEFTDKEKITLFKMGKDQKLTDDESKQKAKRTLIMRYFDRLHAKGKHIKDILT